MEEHSKAKQDYSSVPLQCNDGFVTKNLGKHSPSPGAIRTSKKHVI
jgi:hypothetical protein